jgi:hypothetical protein
MGGGTVWGQTRGEAIPPEKLPALLVPRLSEAPAIDGVIDAAEWREATAISGPGDWQGDLLIPRPTTFYFGWQPEAMYFACRTWLRPGYKPMVPDGRSPGNAYIGDDALELHWQPLGANVAPGNTGSSYKWFLNTLGFTGDHTRFGLGQAFKSWSPRFEIKTRITEPGTAPNGGSWWELEMRAVPEDFEMVGPFRADDAWRAMLAINHFPMWMQARIPCNGGFQEASGYTPLTLVENIPAVQMTMDSLENLASDGTAALKIAMFNPTAAAVKLDLEIDVAGVIQKRDTLNLAPGKSAEVSLNQKLPEDVKKGEVQVRVLLGNGSTGLTAGRKLFQYYSRFEVGKFNQTMLAPVTPRDPGKFDWRTTWNPLKSLLRVGGDTYCLPDPKQARALRYRVTAKGSDTPIAEGHITRLFDFFLEDIIELPPLKPGTYRVEASMELAGGRKLGPFSRTFEKKDEAKEFARWWGKKCGNIERVLKPFAPLRAAKVSGFRVQGSGAETQNLKPETYSGFSLLGREYAFDALGLPLALRSQGEAVLAAPARIVVTAGGKETVIPVGQPKITEQKDWRVCFEGKARGAGLVFSATGWLEQDGLVYVQLTYRPEGKSPVQIDALRIEYPLAETDADALLCIGPGANYSSKTTMLLPDGKKGPSTELRASRLWSTLDTGLSGAKMTVGSFYPTVWIGSERRGFLWWADNDKGWVQDDAVPAHEVVRVQDSGNRVQDGKGADSTSPEPRTLNPDPSSVVLRNNIVAKPVKLAGPQTIAFSYNATPFKPMPQGFRTAISTADDTFFEPFRGVRKDSKTGKPVLTTPGQHVNWIHPESRYPEEWPALWAEQKKAADAHAQANQLTNPYGARFGINFTHMSFQIMQYGRKSLEDHLYNYFGPEWDPGTDTWNESYIDYAMTLFEPAFRGGGVRSTYWDLMFPALFDNPLSGLAYQLPDGRTQPGYNGWNLRRFFMRLHALQLDAGLVPGGIGFHSTNAYLPVAMPWGDAVLDGERIWDLDSMATDWVDNMPVARMRAMSVPQSWGVAICWMANMQSKDHAKVDRHKIRQAHWVWMHDSWLNPYIGQLSSMPSRVQDWGVNGADTVYHPYWRNPFVTGKDADVLVSLWRMPAENRVMLGVFNLDVGKAKDAELTVDLKAMGIAPDAAFVRTLYSLTNGVPPAAFDPATGVVRIKRLPPHELILIGLGAQDPAEIKRAAAALPAWLEGKLPEAVVDFGMLRKETKHFAAGQPVPGVTCGDPAVEIGVWQLPDRLLIQMYNTDPKQARKVPLTIDLTTLGMMPELPWQQSIGTRVLYPAEKQKLWVQGTNEQGHTVLQGNPQVMQLAPRTGRLVAVRRY